MLKPLAMLSYLILPFIINANTPAYEPLHFRRIVREVALKIGQRCLAEYRKECRENPRLCQPDPDSNPDDPTLAFAWTTFRQMLWNSLHKNSPKNCQLIVDRCRLMAPLDSVEELSFCEFGIMFMFVKRHIDSLSLSRQSKENMQEMLKTMENTYKIGWERQKQEIAKKLKKEKIQAQNGRRRTIKHLAYLDFDNITRSAKMELKTVRFMHDFESIDREWAYYMLCQLRLRCKSQELPVYAGTDEMASWYRKARSMLGGVPLESRQSSYNLAEINSTCEVLFNEKDERALCEYAKKLAYFDAYYHKFEFDMLRESSCCGLMSSQDAGIKNLGHFLGTLRQIYESEVARLSATFAIDTERNKYSRKMDYQKMAEGVESVIGAFV